MPVLVCANSDCSSKFTSKHSTAKYCSRRCAGIASMRTAEVAERQRLKMRKYTDEELLAALTKQAATLGRTPTYREVRPRATVFDDRFGAYRNAVLLAGLPPRVRLPKQYFSEDGSQRAIPLRMRFTVLRRDGFRCQYCGGTPQDGYELQIDHKVPWNRGGKTVLENLITACFLCNSGKSNSLSFSFFLAPVAQWQRHAGRMGI